MERFRGWRSKARAKRLVQQQREAESTTTENVTSRNVQLEEIGERMKSAENSLSNLQVAWEAVDADTVRFSSALRSLGSALTEFAADSDARELASLAEQKQTEHNAEAFRQLSHMLADVATAVECFAQTLNAKEACVMLRDIVHESESLKQLRSDCEQCLRQRSTAHEKLLALHANSKFGEARHVAKARLLQSQRRVAAQNFDASFAALWRKSASVLTRRVSVVAQQKIRAVEASNDLLHSLHAPTVSRLDTAATLENILPAVSETFDDEIKKRLPREVFLLPHTEAADFDIEQKKRGLTGVGTRATLSEDASAFRKYRQKHGHPRPIALAAGESLLMQVDNVVYVPSDAFFSTPGSLFLTNFQLVFHPMLPLNSQREVQPTWSLPVAWISKFERADMSQGGGAGAKTSLVIWSKDLLTLELQFQFAQLSDDTQTFGETLLRRFVPLLQERVVSRPFAFDYGGADYNRLADAVGFVTERAQYEYNALVEWRRLGVGSQDGEMPCEYFRITRANENFLLCETYPKLLCVPTSVGDPSLPECASFRAKNRLPVLSWTDRNRALVRCAQPRVGMQSRRSRADEYMLASLAVAAARWNRDRQLDDSTMHVLHKQDTMDAAVSEEAANRGVWIFDARPKLNAVGNIARGGGYEREKHYADCCFNFLNVGNIHVVRQSFAALRAQFATLPLLSDQFILEAPSHAMGELDLEPSEAWHHRYDAVERQLRRADSACDWFRHVSALLTGAARVVQALEEDTSVVLVHCSDGWDRTAQLTCLAQLLLDARFRTLRGFAGLVRKEWCDFGHKFARRLGHSFDENERLNSADSQRSPVFAQFLDCVFQVVVQHPHEFEFTPLLLQELLESAHNCRFGDFLCDSAKERAEANIEQETQSVWSELLTEQSEFAERLRNAAFRPSGRVLQVRTKPEHLRLWRGAYSRWDVMTVPHHPRRLGSLLHPHMAIPERPRLPPPAPPTPPSQPCRLLPLHPYLLTSLPSVTTVASVVADASDDAGTYATHGPRCRALRG
ncbi:MAG: hypothetical protein MHM6MM_005809, partial [Cercozoa sp. M6MM]